MKRKLSLIPEPVSLQQSQVRSIKTSQSCDDQDTYISKRIDREIEEGQDGSKKVKEVETSTTNTRSRKYERSVEMKEIIKHKLEILNNSKNSASLIQNSVIGRPRFVEIESNRARFAAIHPRWTLQKNAKQNIAFASSFSDALSVFSGAPFVDFDWVDIVDTKMPLSEANVVCITLNKLIWTAAMSSDNDTKWDASAKLLLISFDIETATAEVQFILEERDVNIRLMFDQVDPFLLMTLPNEKDRQRVRMVTNCLDQ